MSKTFFAINMLFTFSVSGIAAADVPGAADIRAILDLPKLADLLNGGPITKIEKTDDKANIYEIDAGFCKAKVKVIRDQDGTSSPRAESLGAECGP